MHGPFVSFGLIAFPVLATIVTFWIIPLFQNSPTAVENFRRLHPDRMSYRAESMGTFSKVRYKLAGLKQSLFTALVVAASVIVLAYDTLAPLLGTVDFTPITSQINPLWLVAANVTVPLLLLGLRKLAERRRKLTF